MILTLLLSAFILLFEILFSVFLLLPDVSLPLNFADAVSHMVNYVAPFYSILPFSEVVGALQIVISFEVVFNSYKIIVFIYKRIKS
jgi:hypothetical protein